MRNRWIHKKLAAAIAIAIVVTTGSVAFSYGSNGFSVRQLMIGLDANNADNPFIQPQDPAQAGNGRDQTQQNTDILAGSPGPDVIIGRLGQDIIAGDRGDDVMIGGPEHFVGPNRDKAFGGDGDDVFLWSPGDGSDFFDGGRGVDTVVFGLLGQKLGNDVVFQVINDGQAGEVVLDPGTNLPMIDVVNSPGFCELLDKSLSEEFGQQLDRLGLDQLVQFFIRPVADAFAAGQQSTDNGLRVTLHLNDVEILVCTNRAGGRIDVFDLTQAPPRRLPLEALPRRVQAMLVDSSKF